MLAVMIPFAEIQHRLLTAYAGPIRPQFRRMLVRGETSYATWWVRRGTVVVERLDRTEHLRRGDWAFFDPFESRKHDFSPEAEVLSIRFQVLWRGAHGLPGLRAGAELGGRGRRPLRQAGERLVGAQAVAVAAPGDLASACEAEAALLTWLGIWYKLRTIGAGGTTASPTQDRRLDQMLALLDERPAAGVTDYARLMAETSLSRSQIDRIFRAHLGTTPRQWRQRRVLGQAQEALARSNRRIKEIAHELGFVDTAHFSKWFRQHTGQTPLAARRAG